MNIQHLFKNILYRQPPYTEKLGLRDHDKLGFDWLLQGYIPRGGLVCLQTNVADAALDWTLELGHFYMSLGPLYMGLDHESGDFLLVNNNLPAGFIPQRSSGNKSQLPFWNVFNSRFLQTRASLYDDMERLIRKMEKSRMLLMAVTHLPLYLSALGHEAESEILETLSILKEEAVANNCTVLAICPRTKNAPLLEKASGCVAAVADTVLNFNWLHDSKGIYEFSVKHKFPQHNVKEPAYITWDRAKKGFGILNNMLDPAPENSGRRTPSEWKDRRDLARNLKAHGVDCHKIARIFGVNVSTIYKWTQQNNEDKSGIPFPETSDGKVLRFKGKIIFDGKFHYSIRTKILFYLTVHRMS